MVIYMEPENKFGDISEKSAIAAISKRRNVMKILLFLTNDKDKEETYYLQRIADELDICEMTAFQNLAKLIDAGIVEKSETKVDMRTKYYSVVNKKLAERAIEKYNYWVAFELARFVPYERIFTITLRKDKRFIEVCNEYGITPSQGIQAVLSCPKVGSETMGNETVVWRKEQGYIPPENEETETKPTEVEEIE